MKETDWRILTVLYEKKNMTRAAESLYMTQSALTKRVRAIEDEWGVEVVKRSSQGVLFTEEGKYLVNKANIMLDFLKEIEQHFSGSERSRELLRIGVPNSFARIHMPQLLKEYLSGHNRLQIRTVANTSDVLIQQLTAGSIDIGIICGDYPYLGEKVCLLDEEMFIVTPKGMRLEEIERQTLIESYYNPLVKLMVKQWWQSHFGFVPQDTYSVPHADIAIEMVENGIGVTFVFGNRWKVDGEKLEKIPVYDNQGKPVSRKVWMMMADQCFRSADICEFISFVESYFHVNETM